MSPPAWGRGLKPRIPLLKYPSKMSPPAWGRGLKLGNGNIMGGRGAVAPRVGAWIETDLQRRKLRLVLVAPRVGAWIETISPMNASGMAGVAPRVGAWIETRRLGHANVNITRRPPRGGVD